MLGCVAVTSTATGSAVVHRDVRWVFPPFRLHFICCADAGSCNKSRQALDDDLVRAVKLCLITTKKMISEGIHRVFKKGHFNGIAWPDGPAIDKPSHQRNEMRMPNVGPRVVTWKFGLPGNSRILSTYGGSFQIMQNSVRFCFAKVGAGGARFLSVRSLEAVKFQKTVKTFVVFRQAQAALHFLFPSGNRSEILGNPTDRRCSR